MASEKMKSLLPALVDNRSRCFWQFVLVLTVYLTLDFVDPMMPGAFNFDVDLNKDVIQTESAATLEEPQQTLPAPAHRAIEPAETKERPGVARLAVRYVVADWMTALRQSHTPGRSSTSPSGEDH